VVSSIFGLPVAPRPVPLRRRILFVAVLTMLCLVAVEAAMFLLYGPAELRNAWRGMAATRLHDLPYAEFVAKQKRIQAVRANLGMERALHHPLFGWTYNPGFRIDDPEIQLHISSLGLRGEEFPIAKPPGEFRILCLGGSTTAGEEVREAETYPAQLEAMLRAHNPGRTIRVINGGIPAYDLPESLRLFELNQYRFDADVVTVYHGINDLYAHRGADADIPRRENYTGRPTMPFYLEGQAESSWSLPPLDHFLDVVARNSYLASAGHELRRAALAAFRAPLAQPDSAGLETFEREYRALDRAIAGSRAVPLAMTFAISWPGQFDAADRRRIETSFLPWARGARTSLQGASDIIDLQNERIRKVAREEGWSVSEIAGAIPPDRAHFDDVCHLTVEGNRRIAERLAADIQPILERRRGPDRARALF
jgi:lysophospholipase L1-like esterase